MKRLAVGTVLFLLSFSIPAPGSANLVFFSSDAGKSLNSIGNNYGKYAPNSSELKIFTPAPVATPPQIPAAAQQFSASLFNDSGLTHALPSQLARARERANGAAAAAGRLLPDLVEWALVMVGFALAGIGLRNRSSSRLDDRNPRLSRLPSDL